MPRNALPLAGSLLACLSIACARTEVGASPSPDAAASAEAPLPHGAVPSERQLAWHEREFYGFLHFTTNTFTDKEWGYGDESPDVFDPTDFDADQIVGVAAAAGMKGLILTCKHHDGFCLWPSEFTDHDIATSPFKGGKGDVVREISDACRRFGIGFGVYLSPWDRNHPDYGGPGYIECFQGQLRELLTNYGPVFEVWWDGANGGDGYYGGARESRRIDRGSYYRWDENIAMVRELQPDATIFSDAGPDVRWVGNERGIAGDPCWATYDPTPREGESLAAPGTTKHEEGVNGHRDGALWIPAEADVSIRPGWFYHSSQDSRVKTPEELVDLHYRSIGRGASFLLNLPPDRRGRIHERDEASLRGYRRILDLTFTENLASGAAAEASDVRGPGHDAANVLDGDEGTFWATTDDGPAPHLTLTLPEPRWFNVVSIREHLPLGLRVDDWVLESWKDGAWQEFARGTGVGARRLWRGAYQFSDRVRIRFEDPSACPAITEVGLFAEPARVTMHGAPAAFLGRAEVELRCDRADAAIHYTVDGSKPHAGSPRYAGPIALTESCLLRAAAVTDGVASPFEASRTFEAWSGTSLLAPDAELAAEQGLAFDYFEGGWQTLDQMESAEPVRRGVAQRVAIPAEARDEHFAVAFTGTIDVPADGIYTFALTSDDGSRFFLHDELRIDNDGLHGAIEKTCQVGLAAGRHRIRVEYFNATGGKALSLGWEGPGFGREPVPAAALGR